MYSVRDYGMMIGDERRTGAYVEALRRTVKPGSVVLDIGTGAGVLAMAACRFGARRVYAVEPGDVIELARELAAENGFADRIEFIQDFSTAIELPEPADVVVAEIHGLLPLFGKSLATLIDARKRLLAPGGAMIPASETIFASVVEAPQLHSRLVSPWSKKWLDIDMRRGRRHVINEFYRAEFGRAELVAPPATIATLDYQRIDGTDVSARVVMQASRSATAHGLGLWFESALADGVRMSNAPGEPALIFGNAYFPWPEAVDIVAGDTIEVDLAASQLQDHYLWRWNSRVSSAGRLRAAFRQSQLDSAMIVPEKLKRQAASYVPRLNGEGEMQRVALARIAEGRALGEIATELAESFPRQFAGWHEALNWVGALALRCGD